MDMASFSFVKEFRDLVKKKPKNGTVPSLTSLDEEEEADSPITPRKFDRSFLDGECGVTCSLYTNKTNGNEIVRYYFKGEEKANESL